VGNRRFFNTFFNHSPRPSTAQPTSKPGLGPAPNGLFHRFHSAYYSYYGIFN